MTKNHKTLAESHRNSYTKITLAFFLLLAAWLIYQGYTQPNLISKSTGKGQVVSIIISNDNTQDSGIWLEVKVDNKVFRDIINKRPVPKVNDIIPVTIEKYSNGVIYYSIQYEQWRSSQIGY